MPPTCAQYPFLKQLSSQNLTASRTAARKRRQMQKTLTLRSGRLICTRSRQIIATRQTDLLQRMYLCMRRIQSATEIEGMLAEWNTVVGPGPSPFVQASISCKSEIKRSSSTCSLVSISIIVSDNTSQVSCSFRPFCPALLACKIHPKSIVKSSPGLPLETSLTNDLKYSCISLKSDNQSEHQQQRMSQLRVLNQFFPKIVPKAQSKYQRQLQLNYKASDASPIAKSRMAESLKIMQEMRNNDSFKDKHYKAFSKAVYLIDKSQHSEEQLVPAWAKGKSRLPSLLLKQRPQRVVSLVKQENDSQFDIGSYLLQRLKRIKPKHAKQIKKQLVEVADIDPKSDSISKLEDLARRMQNQLFSGLGIYRELIQEDLLKVRKIATRKPKKN